MNTSITYFLLDTPEKTCEQWLMHALRRVKSFLVPGIVALSQPPRVEPVDGGHLVFLDGMVMTESRRAYPIDRCIAFELVRVEGGNTKIIASAVEGCEGYLRDVLRDVLRDFPSTLPYLADYLGLAAPSTPAAAKVTTPKRKRDKSMTDDERRELADGYRKARKGRDVVTLEAWARGRNVSRRTLRRCLDDFPE